MDVPGVSLFQGGESIKLDTSATRLEEEEALEDQRRRNEELGNQLQNAFDDLIDDDDYTIDTSEHFQSNLSHDSVPNNFREHRKKNPLSQSPVKELESDQNNNRVDLLNEIQRLKNIINSKNSEIENITKIVFEERKEKDELKKRYALSEAEKERAHMSRKQTHELLVESKTKIAELEDNISTLKVKMKTMEKANNDLTEELERTKTTLSDAQQKFHLVERNAGLASDRQRDMIFKQTNERHSAQMEILTQQIENLRGKLEDKEMEYKTLDIRYKELQRSREALLIEKSETINQLARNLEESQRHCQQLISKDDYSHENIRLQRLANSLEKQTEDMQKTINNLTSRLEATTSELEIMDSIICENGVDTNSLRRLSMTKGNFVGSTPLTTNDRLNRLKNELYRSMSAQKSKREDIKKLQEEIVNKNDEIKRLKDEENKALVQINTYKEENIRLENRLRILERELNFIRDSDEQKQLQNDIKTLRSKNQLLEKDLSNSKNEYEIFKERYDHLNNELNELRAKLKNYEEINSERKLLNSQIKTLSSDLEDLKQKHINLETNYEDILQENSNLKISKNSEDLKLELENQKSLFKDAQNECIRLKNLYIEISESKEILKLELNEFKNMDIYKNLEDEKTRCANLEKALELAEIKCTELKSLLEKEKLIYEQEINNINDRLKKDNSDVKAMKNSSNNCVKCLEHVTELSKMEIQNLKLQNQCSNYHKELNDLQAKLDTTKITILDLNEKLSLKDQHDKLIVDLKEKAQQFEEYIKNQSDSKETSSGISSSPKLIESCDKSVETSPELEMNYTRRKIENQIREEMAKIFAGEIKNIQEHYKKISFNIEQENTQIKIELKQIKYELQLRQNEVNLLKHAILAEREKMQEILDEKQFDLKQTIEKYTDLLEKCRNDIKIKQDLIQKLRIEIDDRTKQIDNERRSMNSVVNKWDEEKKSLEKKYDEIQMKMNDMQKNYEKNIEQIQMKYNSAKKTAANYKRYAEDKEKHMLEEYERIKSGYQESVSKLENRMKSIIEKQKTKMK